MAAAVDGFYSWRDAEEGGTDIRTKRQIIYRFVRAPPEREPRPQSQGNRR